MDSRGGIRVDRATMLQEAVENGARAQWRNDASWIVDTLAVTDPPTAQYLGELMGEPLDPNEMAKARKLEIDGKCWRPGGPT